MRHDIIEHDLGREDQAPGKRQVPGARATAPARRGVAHADVADLLSDRLRQLLGAGAQLALGESAEEIAHPARQECRIAGDADFARLDPGWTAPADIPHVANEMRLIEDRHRRAFCEAEARRQ